MDGYILNRGRRTLQERVIGYWSFVTGHWSFRNWVEDKGGEMSRELNRYSTASRSELVMVGTHVATAPGTICAKITLFNQ